MKRKIINLVVVIVSMILKDGSAQSLHRFDYERSDINQPLKAVYVDQFGKIVYRPDSTVFIDGTRHSKNGVVAIENKDFVKGKSTVFLIDSLGKELSKFESYSYNSASFSLDGGKYHSILSLGKERLFLYSDGGERYFSPETIIIDSNGKILLKLPSGARSNFEYAGDGFFKYTESDETYLISDDGYSKRIRLPKHISIYSVKISEGLMPFEYFKNNQEGIKSDKKYGYLDVNGNVVIEPVFKEAYPFSNNRAVVSITDDEYFLINKSGRRVSDVTFSKFFGIFREGLLSVQRQKTDEVFSYIDTLGNFEIPEAYMYASAFKDGKALVSKERKKYFLIDKEGSRISGDIFSSRNTWWDSSVYYDGFSGNLFNFKTKKPVFKTPNWSIIISNIDQLLQYDNLSEVEVLEVKDLHFNYGQPINIPIEVNELTNLKMLSLFNGANTHNVNFSLLFKLRSIEKVEIYFKCTSDISSIKNLINLRSLQLEATDFERSFKAIQGLNKLESLILNGSFSKKLVDNLLKLRKGVKVVVMNSHLLSKEEADLLSKHFTSISGSFGKALKSSLEMEIPVTNNN